MEKAVAVGGHDVAASKTGGLVVHSGSRLPIHTVVDWDSSRATTRRESPLGGDDAFATERTE